MHVVLIEEFLRILVTHKVHHNHREVCKAGRNNELASLCVDWKLDREGVWSPSVPFAQALERLEY